MKLYDLEALYDNVSLKLTKQNRYIVDYILIDSCLGCHSNSPLLGFFEQSKNAAHYVVPSIDKRMSLRESIDIIYEAMDHATKSQVLQR